MRYTSVGCTVVVPLSARRRLGFLVWSKWRLPARERRTFPLAVILNRLATDFLVLMPLGRRIINQLSFKKSAQYRWRWAPKQAVFLEFSGSPRSPTPNRQRQVP